MNNKFELSYLGEALNNGDIDAKVFAPSLLSLVDIVEQTTKLLYEDSVITKLKVNSNFRQGSFITELMGAISFYQDTIDFINGDQFQAWATISGVVGITGTGLFQVIKRLKGNTLEKFIQIERTEKYKLTFSDGTEDIVDKAVIKLLDNDKVRKSLEQFVKPLKANGIEAISINNNNSEVRIEKDELNYFKAPQENSRETYFTNDILLKIVSPSFKPDNKWRVFDGARTLHVHIVDQEFKDRIASRKELFGAGDYLRCRLTTAQWFEDGKLKSRHEIEEVFEHIESEESRQTKLLDDQ